MRRKEVKKIGTLAWKPPYAVGVAQKRQKTKEKREKKKIGRKEGMGGKREVEQKCEGERGVEEKWGKSG